MKLAQSDIAKNQIKKSGKVFFYLRFRDTIASNLVDDLRCSYSLTLV